MWGISYYPIIRIKEIRNKKKEEPFWKRKIESKINALRKDDSLIERWDTGMLRKESRKTKLDHLHRVKKKAYKRAAEELKQQIKAKAATLKRYKLYQELDGKSHEKNIIPDKEKAKEFWSGLWEKNVKHNENADWIQKVAEEMHDNKM